MPRLKYDNLTLVGRKELLLKTLGIRPERIEQLKNGETLLTEVLNERIREVIDNPDDTTQCAIICQNIRLEGVSYDNLDPVPHLDQINDMKARGGTFADDVSYGHTGGFGPSFTNRNYADTDTSAPSGSSDGYGSNASNSGSYGYNSASTGSHTAGPVFASPIRRFGARMVDLSICLLIINVAFRIVFKSDPLSNSRLNVLWVYIVYVAMLLVEPLLLHRFRTTPGKLIFGIRISGEDDSPLSLQQAYLRSFRLLRFGYGFIIPFYSLFRLGVSFSACRQGAVLPWDYGTRIDYPGKASAKHIAICIILLAMLSSADTCINWYCEVPRVRGEFTVDTFRDNMAYIARYDSLKIPETPDFEFQTVNGKVTGLTLTIEGGNASTIYPYDVELFTAFLALAGSRPEFNPISFNLSGIDRYFENSLTDFSFTYAGLNVTNTVECEGYIRNIMYGYLYEDAEADTHSFKQTFTIR